MRDEKSCGAVIYIKNRNTFEYLLIQSNRSNFWGFPKGHVEKDESEVETAFREIFEETGLKVNFIPNFREEINYKISKDLDKKVVFFLAEVNSYDIFCQLEELKGYAWMSFDEAHAKLKFENLKLILKNANEFLLQNF